MNKVNDSVINKVNDSVIIVNGFLFVMFLFCKIKLFVIIYFC